MKMVSIAVIALMGVTGSGKSNFIRLVTELSGAAAPEVGHDLVSCNENIILTRTTESANRS